MEDRDHFLSRIEAQIRRLLEQAHDDVGERQWYVAAFGEGGGRRIVKDRVQRVDHVLASERAPAGQHLEEHRAEREQVSPHVHVQSADLLRCEITRCSEHDPGHRGEAVASHFSFGELRDAKVQDLGHTASGQEDVVRLQVAMDQAGRVRACETARDLHADPQHVVHRHRAAFDAGAQRFSFEQLGDEIRVFRRAADVVDADDVRVVQGGREASFVDETLDAVRIARSRVRKYFKRDVATQPGVGRTVDIACAAAGE